MGFIHLPTHNVIKKTNFHIKDPNLHDSTQVTHLTVLSTYEIQMTISNTQFQFQTIYTFSPVGKEALHVQLLGPQNICKARPPPTF